MRVRCTNIDLENFPIPEEQRAYFRARFGRGAVRLFKSVEVGRTYVVYAIQVSDKFPFYYVSNRDRDDDWMFVPTLCFDVIDSRVSKFWHVGTRPTMGLTPGRALITTVAIKEWIDEPGFFEHLVDRKERELRIMREAAATMNAEFEN